MEGKRKKTLVWHISTLPFKVFNLSGYFYVVANNYSSVPQFSHHIFKLSPSCVSLSSSGLTCHPPHPAASCTLQSPAPVGSWDPAACRNPACCWRCWRGSGTAEPPGSWPCSGDLLVVRRSVPESQPACPPKTLSVGIGGSRWLKFRDVTWYWWNSVHVKIC